MKITDQAATAWSDALDAGRPAHIRAMRLEIERLRADAKSWREDGDAMHTDSASMTGQAAVDVRRAGISRMQRADEIDAQADALEALQSSEPTS